MSSIILLLCSLVAGDLPSTSYKDAYYGAYFTDKPMLVLVSASWCGPCQEMKNKVLPEMAKAGELSKVNLVILDVDTDPDLCKQIMDGSTIPQTIVFKRERGQWLRRSLTGKQNRESLRDLLK